MAVSATSAAASSATSVAATNDVDSEDNEASEEEESGDLVVSSNDDDDSSDNEVDNVSATNLDDVFFHAARNIQNRTSRIVGTAEMEERHFCKLFGACMEIVIHLWEMIEKGDLLPEKSKPKHLLWTLYFLKVYPREGPGCSAVGGSGGAVDPKTLRKWVWLFVERIDELADDVVSAVYCRVPLTFVFSPRRPLRLPDRLRKQARFP
jgi:hypothetical protein